MNHNSATEMRAGSAITEQQNTPAAIEQLAAQRQLYREAKRVGTIRLSASLTLAIASFGLPHLWPQGVSWLRAFAGLWLVVDVVMLRELAKNLHAQAALIQELFDTTVLVLPWNKVAAGEKPIHEQVVSAARRFAAQHGDQEVLRNWYPDVSRLSLAPARLVCQRTNIVWDEQLRLRYSSIVLVMTCGLIVATLIHALVTGSTILDYLLTFLPAMPAVILGAEVTKGHRAAVTRLSELRRLVQDSWQQMLSGSMSDEECLALSRRLQDQILINRRHNPLVPEIVYRRLRKSHEADTWEAAERLVEEARATSERDSDLELPAKADGSKSLES